MTAHNIKILRPSAVYDRAYSGETVIRVYAKILNLYDGRER